MAAKIVGQVSIGQVVPTTAALIADATADIQAKLAGALKLSLALSLSPPSISAQITGALETVVKLEAALSAGITLPGASLSVAANVALLAELSAKLAALLALSVTLGTAGVYVITDEGDAEKFGSDMQKRVSEIAPAGNKVHAVTFLATDPATYEALGKVLLTG